MERDAERIVLADADHQHLGEVRPQDGCHGGAQAHCVSMHQLGEHFTRVSQIDAGMSKLRNDHLCLRGRRAASRSRWCGGTVRRQSRTSAARWSVPSFGLWRLLLSHDSFREGRR